MSILKRSKESMATFRPAVLTENDSNKNCSSEQENQSEKREKVIENMAQGLLEKPNKKHPLDMVSRNVNIAISVRTLAEWRYVANLEGRNMSDFIRRAVDFYIRKNGLDK